MLLWALGLAIRHWALAGILGVLLRILGGEGGGWGGCCQVLQIQTLLQTKKFPFFTPKIHTRFQTRPLRNDIIITLERQQNRFLKIHFEFASDFSFSLPHLELKR